MAWPQAYGAGYGAMGGTWDPHVSPQFAQPTKVIHLRNLAFDITPEELREFCSPFGQAVAVKGQVSANKNQAFVEMATIEQAVAIVSHYAQVTEPAKIRGRPTWLSYSGRHQLTNVTTSFNENPSAVLQAEVRAIPPDLAQAVNLDLLNMVFGAFGFVKKMATLPRPDGVSLTAWVQFSDAATAAHVKQTLDGQAIPSHLINDHATPPTLSIQFSVYNDIPVRIQSACTRDFTSSALQWGEPDWATVQGLLPAGGLEGPSNVLSVSFDQQTYPVKVDGIHTIFSTYGFVQKIHLYEREGKTVALVQYPDIPTAEAARAALQGHAMYDGGHNVMHVVYSKHRDLVIRPGSERSKDFTKPQGPAPGVAPLAPGALPPPGAAAAAAGAPPPYGGPPAGGYPPPGGYVPPPAAAGAPPPAAGGYAAAAPAGGPPAGVPPAAQGPPPSAAAAPAGHQPFQPRYDPHFQVTGEDFVRQHERVLEQAGGRTSGPPRPAPYAAPYGAPPAPGAYPPPPSAYPPAPAPGAWGPPPPAAYGGYPYAAPPGGAYPPAPYGAPPPAAPGWGVPPPAAPAAYGAPPPAAPGVPPPAAPQAAYGQAPPPAAYGAPPQAPPYQQPPPAGAYPGYGYQ